MKVEPIKIRLRRASEPSIFHDSREDVRNIAKVVNLCIEKINELADVVNAKEEHGK